MFENIFRNKSHQFQSNETAAVEPNSRMSLVMNQPRKKGVEKKQTLRNLKIVWYLFPFKYER